MVRTRRVSHRPYPRLPSGGAHGLSAAAVGRHQRGRLQGAMLTATARHGYQATTIRELVALAGVSRTAFYAHYAGKPECFWATFDTILEIATEQISEAYRRPGDWRDRLHAGFTRFGEIVRSEPDAARLVIVEALTMGTGALRRRETAAGAFHQMLAQSFGQAPSGAAVAPITIRTIIAGLKHVTYRALRSDEPETLGDNIDALLDWAIGYQHPAAVPLGETLDLNLDLSLDESERLSAQEPEAPQRRPHRERILRAVAEVCAESGYEALTIPRITATAGISNQTFYEHFAHKQDAFLAAADVAGEQAFGAGSDAYQRAADWPQAVRDGIEALLGHLAADPTLARISFFEIPAAGPAALRRPEKILDSFAGFLEPGRHERPDLPPIVTQAIVGGIWGAIRHQLHHHDPRLLPPLAPSLTYIALNPFIGSERAAAAAASAVPAGR